MTWPCETLAYLPQLPTWGKGQMRGSNEEKKQQHIETSRKDCFVREVNDFVHPYIVNNNPISQIEKKRKMTLFPGVALVTGAASGM